MLNIAISLAYNFRFIHSGTFSKIFLYRRIFHPTLVSDSQPETESQLNFYVEDPDEIDEKFDDITYSKGE